jgi:hypothetical protein
MSEEKMEIENENDTPGNCECMKRRKYCHSLSRVSHCAIELRKFTNLSLLSRHN